MLISLENVTHIYNQKRAKKALNNINLSIARNEFIGLIGSTGSGKSTLVQLLNALIIPSQGQVKIDGTDITKKDVNLKNIRQKVGLVFQYPEHQLFEETVADEIAFGPRNLNLAQDKISDRVQQALNLVGLDYQKFKERSPFNLSGGQQRRVALAGVLAMSPDVLILDEPFAGLDPDGRKSLVQLLTHLHQNQEITIILISHRMAEIARLATRVIVLKQGEIALNGSPGEVFSQVEKIRDLSLDLPQITEILYKLNQKGFNLRTDIFSISEAAAKISSIIKEQKVDVK